jgi:hypothetical protein
MGWSIPYTDWPSWAGRSIPWAPALTPLNPLPMPRPSKWLGRQAYQQALRYQADTFASVWLENNPDGTFMVHQLPNLAQISPIQRYNCQLMWTATATPI